MRLEPPERVTLLVGALVLVASFGVGGYTYATFVDVETTSASIQAAGDFTTSIDVVRIEPTRIEANSGGGLASSEGEGDDGGDGDGDDGDADTRGGNGVFTVYADVPEPASVDSGRFTLRVAGGEESIRALRARCKTDAGGDWTCQATFSRRDLLALGVEPGPVTLVLQGWREYDRDFEGTGVVGIVDAGPTSTAAEATGPDTPTEAAASVGSDTPTQIETPAESSTATETGTTTGTDETDTLTESSTATEIATDGTDTPTDATESTRATTTTNTTEPAATTSEEE